ncbi:prepilin-type N-terminal cleavage/methylation domain-containing protein [bacterium]|nr:prepilin-type N-terminal cleavage/methylation domain-containing protein [bacterium]
MSMQRDQPGPRSPQRRGVTLLELLVVVTLVGILSTAVVGRYGRAVFGDFGARTEAHQLWLDIQLARREAIRTGLPYTVLMTGSSAGSWTGYEIVAGSSAEARSGRGETIGEPRIFPTEMTASGDSATVEFNFEGQADRAVTLQLRGPHRSWQVQVLPLIGSVIVTENTSS